LSCYCHDPHIWNNEGINLPMNSKELYLGFYFNLENQLYDAGIADCKSKFSIEK